MLNRSTLVKQCVSMNEGLAALQMLTSHLSGTSVVSCTKTYNLSLEMLMVRPFAASPDCVEFRSCSNPCAEAESNAA